MNEQLLAQTLCSLRADIGETQETVAAALGISPKTLSKWENGASEPELSMLCALADHYGVSIDRLLGRNSEQKTTEERIDAELSPLNAKDAVSHIFTSQLTAMHRLVSHLIHCGNKASAPTVPPQILEGAARSLLSSDTAYVLGVNRDALNLYVMLCGNQNNFSWLSDDEVICRMTKMFTLLSMPDTLALLRLLNTNGFPSDFSAAYAANKADITLESAEAILPELASFGICSAETAHLADGDRTVYHCEGSGLLLTVLSLIYELLFPINVNYYASHGKCRLIVSDDRGGEQT